MQSINRDTDVENKYMDTKRERRRVGGIGRLGLTYTYAIDTMYKIVGFPGGSVVKNPPAKAGVRRHGFNCWAGKIPRRRKWQPTLFIILA